MRSETAATVGSVSLWHWFCPQDLSVDDSSDIGPGTSRGRTRRLWGSVGGTKAHGVPMALEYKAHPGGYHDAAEIGAKGSRSRAGRGGWCAVVLALTLVPGRAPAQGQEPPTLTLPRVVVVGVDTLRVGGAKTALPLPKPVEVEPLIPEPIASTPAAPLSELPRSKPLSVFISLAGGASRSLDWRASAEWFVNESRWAARAARGASHDPRYGLGSWWREEVSVSGGGRARIGGWWQRVGYRSADGPEQLSLARPWIEWRGTVRARAGWAGGSRGDSWPDAWWMEAELPLSRGLSVRFDGQTDACLAARGVWSLGQGSWQAELGLGSMLPDEGSAEWLAEARGLLELGEAATISIAGRRRAVFHDAFSLLSGNPYAGEALGGWSWAELREEAEVSAEGCLGGVSAQAYAGAWRTEGHPQWRSSTTLARVDAKGSFFGAHLGWSAELVEGRAQATWYLSDVAGQAERLFHTPSYQWLTRLQSQLDPVELALELEGIGPREFGEADLESCVLLTIEVGIPLNDFVTVITRGTNLLDDDYALWAGYPMPGARVLFGVDVSF